MKNRNGSDSNGYFGSFDMLDDIQIAYGFKLGDSLAREFGLVYYIRHKFETVLHVLFLKIRRSNHYYLQELVIKLDRQEKCKT